MHGNHDRLFAQKRHEIQQVKRMDKPAALALLNAIEVSQHKDAFLSQFGFQKRRINLISFVAIAAFCS